MTKDQLVFEHDKLLKEWKSQAIHNKNVFISDGIIDIDKWLKSKKRILFILKEAYGEKTDWNLATTIREDWKGPKYKVWWTVSYWLYLFQNTTESNIPFFPTTPEEFETCSEHLLSAAIINIKKSNGKSSSEHNDLQNYADTDNELLFKQIKLINPDIIICGSTKQYLDKVLKTTPIKIENTDWFYEWNNKIIVDYWHPANQYPNELCYYALGHMYQRMLKK